MSRLRVEVKMTVRVHVGEDVGEEAPPPRLPDAAQSDVQQVSVHELGVFVKPHECVGGHFARILANSSAVLGERLSQQLAENKL